jgi:hypothetical protein
MEYSSRRRRKPRILPKSIKTQNILLLKRNFHARLALPAGDLSGRPRDFEALNPAGGRLFPYLRGKLA